MHSFLSVGSPLGHQTMAEHWDFYFCRVNDVLSSISVDLGARDAAPDPARAHLLWIWVPFRAPRSDGLSSNDEAPTLAAIEDALIGALSRELNAIFVGRITGAGRRELYFYAPASAGFAAAVDATFDRFPGYLPDTGDQEDPQWSQYFEVLYPGPRDFQRMQNRRVVDALRDRGDRLETPRPVTHWIYFEAAADRAAAIARLVSAGFQTEETSDESDAAERPFGLRIERIDRVDEDSIDSTVLQIMDLVEGLDADYDGWESPVMRPTPAPPRGLFARLFSRGSS